MDASGALLGGYTGQQDSQEQAEWGCNFGGGSGCVLFLFS